MEGGEGGREGERGGERRGGREGGREYLELRQQKHEDFRSFQEAQGAHEDGAHAIVHHREDVSHESHVVKQRQPA